MRTSHDPQASRSGSPRKHALDRQRWRCSLGAGICALAFLATFITDLVNDTPDDDSAIVGLELAFVGVGGLLAVTAVLCWALAMYDRLVTDRHSDDLGWAVSLGTRIADAYPAADKPEASNIR